VIKNVKKPAAKQHQIHAGFVIKNPSHQSKTGRQYRKLKSDVFLTGVKARPLLFTRSNSQGRL